MLIPISAPNPNSKPSLNRVLAFQNTAALSTAARKPAAACASAVTIASLCAEPSRLMVAMASSRDRDHADREDQVQELRREVGRGRRPHGGSPRRRGSRRMRRRTQPHAPRGQRGADPRKEPSPRYRGGRGAARRRCRRPGLWVFAFTTIDSAIAGSAALSRYTKHTPV